MRLFGELFNLMLVSMAFGMVLLAGVIGVGFVIYKIWRNKK